MNIGSQTIIINDILDKINNLLIIKKTGNKIIH
jgi:hypothetical protein